MCRPGPAARRPADARQPRRVDGGSGGRIINQYDNENHNNNDNNMNDDSNNDNNHHI